MTAPVGPALPVSAIAGLRTATWAAHQRLEKRLDIKARFDTVGAYRSHLEGMWGFHADLEERLEQKLCGNVLPDFESRRKLPLLTADLLALGADLGSLASLPRCRAALQFPDPAAAFGCAYVLEGATLGGRVLLPQLQKRLGLDAGHGAAFLASYGEAVTPMWRSFGVALDGWCCNPQRQARATDAAVATFDALSDWLCEPAS